MVHRRGLHRRDCQVTRINEIVGLTQPSRESGIRNWPKPKQVYELLRANKAQDDKIDAGIVRRRSLMDRVAVFTRTLNARLVTLIAVLGLFC
ncbi:hypothetical protein ACVWXL_005757 [Bradyrhizobium sp. GM22.5]